MNTFSGLRRAQLSLDYLHANSTTHEFLFGALAEMVDNARDAQATQLEIFDYQNNSVRGGFALCFLDDGEGMLPEEAARVVTFGYSEKRAKAENLIGMYGNGLKSGSMRIGNDLILFTKKNNYLTVLFLSRTFHESEHLIEVIVPVPSFDATTKQPFDDGDAEMHKQELDIILKYSPFKTTSDLLAQFDRITSDTGTLVIIYNLKLLDTGEAELQFTKGDIILANPPGHEFDSDEVLHDEQKSFAAYCSILYIDPRMKIYIQGVKIHTRRLLADLYKPRQYKFSSGRFKTRSEAEVKKAESDAGKYEFLAREAESKARDLQKKCVAQLTNTKLRQESRRADEEASRLRQQAHLYRQLVDRKKKALKDPKTLTFYIGVQVNNRDRDGAFVYNCSRLISMYHRFNEGVPRGLVAVVDVPYLVLEPTHNKQDFADAKEFRHLMRALSEHAMSYCRDLSLDNPEVIEKFWREYGYQDLKDWSTPPSSEMKFIRKRRADVPVVIQCDSCLKWRVLPFSTNPPAQYPSDWHCAQNPDTRSNRCGAPEARQVIPEGVFHRLVVSQADAAEKLQDEIRKKQAQLAKIQPAAASPSPTEKPQKTVESQKAVEAQKPSRNARDVEASSSKSTVAEEKDVKERKELEEPPRSLRARRSATTAIENGAEPEEPAKERKSDVSRAQVRLRSTGRSAKAKEPSSEEEEENKEEDEEDTTESEEEEEQQTVKKRAVARGKPRRSPQKRRSRAPQESDDDSDDEESSEEEEEKRPAQSKRARTLASGKKHPGYDLSHESVAHLVESYRSCIRYFLPPGWKKYNKESVAKLSPERLVNFPQQEFFSEYERGLKSLVAKLRDESMASKKQLGNVRRMVAGLLERILDKPTGTLVQTVSDNPDNHEIDDLLKTCLDRMVDDSKKGNDASSSKQGHTKKSSSAR